MANNWNNLRKMFNIYFDKDWILTGSEAIKLYLEYFNKTDLLTFTPNDIDIVFINDKKFYMNRVDNYIRKQSQPEDSMTFSNGTDSFDITITNKPVYYYEINGIKLMDPIEMFNNYTETDEVKIKALEIIKNKIKSLDKKRIPAYKLSDNKYQQKPVSFKRLLSFDDDSEDDCNKNQKITN